MFRYFFAFIIKEYHHCAVTLIQQLTSCHYIYGFVIRDIKKQSCRCLSYVNRQDRSNTTNYRRTLLGSPIISMQTLVGLVNNKIARHSCSDRLSKIYFYDLNKYYKFLDCQLLCLITMTMTRHPDTVLGNWLTNLLFSWQCVNVLNTSLSCVGMSLSGYMMQSRRMQPPRILKTATTPRQDLSFLLILWIK